MSDIPIVFFFQPIATEYLEKRVVVEKMDMFSVHVLTVLLRRWWQGEQLC
jgi:hypothetical protein